ncbi:Ig domain-containing protein [Paenibacillus sp. WLX1005]|uniref:Ig domain-containing protein n=1 Tax=Paenibacillus sp. WLX1005 TaxID=3243766 RepID=UPI003983F88D
MHARSVKVWCKRSICLLLIAVLLPITTAYADEMKNVAATSDTTAADSTVLSSAQSDQVQIQETITNGFTHPGVNVTAEQLQTMRSMVQQKKEPWYSYYQAMLVSKSASKTVTSSNQDSSDPSKPASVAFNSQGFNSRYIADGLKAYTQAILYYTTGEAVYRANAMHIIRIWSQMDPNQYVYFTDAHIHTGIPSNRMIAAAEILRYTSSPTEELVWTDNDTEQFTNNLIVPVTETFMHTNNRFMNQHTYPLIGAMSGYIFTNNRERYNEAVEWFTVNKTAVNQGFNGSIQQLFRLVDHNSATGEAINPPVVQHVEMGRDQAHGGGDLTNATIIARMMLSQSTKVDPVNGTVSTASNAVGPYEFLNDRILAAADFFWKYMLGYDSDWIPVVYSSEPDGKAKGIYYRFSDSYRGRMNTANFWGLYYYYTYVKGVDLKEKAHYYAEAFQKRIPPNFYHKGALNINWDNPDGGGDFWLSLPQEAVQEGSTNLPNSQTDAAIVELEDRYIVLDARSATEHEGATSFVRVQAVREGSRLAFQNLSYADRSGSRLIGLRFRSDKPATISLSKEKNSTPYHTLHLPNTEGQWRYITYDMGIDHVSYGQLDNDYNLLYLTVVGDDAAVDLDHLNVRAGEQLSPPIFRSDSGSDTKVIPAFTGAPVTLDLAADDSLASDTVQYTADQLPIGAVLDHQTGKLVWTPDTAGTYSFLVTASDGVTVSTQPIRIAVEYSREEAIGVAAATYDPHTLYTTSSVRVFTDVYDATVRSLNSDSDVQFFDRLIRLKQQADQLELLTPTLADGSMDYSAAVTTSTFGTSISMLIDDNNNTYPVYTLARYPNLYHILDFGPDYNISATRFGLQSRMNFVDRMAGSVIYGSNDRSSWTRLTPNESKFTDEMDMLDVSADQQNQRYRYIKIEMIHPQPDVLSGNTNNLLELGEFRIYGIRHEVSHVQLQQ